ncbi:glycine-rich domain-containing protein, partial [Flavobacterium sp.]|uniref:glycine-rich domain-containing protein n=1 Tax=Flavobacterium sp. TaxID=239 RepID=UPI0037BF0DAA
MQTLYKYLALLSVILFFSIKSQAQSLPITSYGVWDRGGGIPDYSAPNADFVKGIETTLDWKDIQAGPGTNNCDFSAFQTILDVAVANNKLIRFSVNVGPDCPLWVFDNGVPLVNVISNAPKNDAYANRNPYYPDPEYKAYYFEMIRQFALFLRNQPQAKFNHIAFVQVKTGCTGDEEPYKGTVTDGTNGTVDNTQYDLTEAQWEAFRLEAFAKFKFYFNDVTTNKIVLTFNNVDPIKYPDAYNYVMTQLDPVLGFGIKGGAFNRGHHLSEEQSYKEQWNPFLINPKVGPGNPNGVKLFSASEMDQSWDKGYFALNYEIGFYWSALGGINTGLSCTNISVSAMTYALANPGIIDIFKMYNRYAQQVYPATATTAFSVFHEGLNSEDTVKFPVSTYGSASRTNLARYQNICNDPKYANRGARIDDPIAVVKGQVFQREDQEFYNDAGWDICEGNIERFMTQINPDATSIGLFRVRGALTLTSSKYDRFARSFENSTGKNTMYFQLHTELPVNNKTLKFTIIWLDKTAGSTWAFKYRNAAGLQSIPFTGTGTNQWRTETITLSDAIMNQGGSLQSDFMLVNTDTTDDIFNGIEMNIIQDQTINFNALPSKKVGEANFSPGATASSGLAVTYTSSNTNVATIVGNNIQIVGSGSCTITASQAGDNYYHPASSVAQYFSVALETKTTITTTGTWTAPAGINKIKVEAWGGGGGGGGTILSGFAGGGAGGSYIINDNVTVVPATIYTVTVGAGGALSGNGGANGNNGGNTTFGSTTPVIANGGVGGSGTNTAGQLGAGGTNSS